MEDIKIPANYNFPKGSYVLVLELYDPVEKTGNQYYYTFHTQDGVEWIRRKLIQGTIRVRNVLLKEMGFRSEEVPHVTYKYIMHVVGEVVYQHMPQFRDHIVEKDL